MAKKKKTNNTISLVRRGVALLASVVTFIFIFLEMIASKTEYYSNILKDETDVKTVGVKFSDFLFSEDYEIVRESFELATTIMWIVFILVIVSVVVTALSLIIKKGTIFSKLGSGILVLAMVLMFVINFDKVEALKITTWYSNMTALYFVALVLSIGGFASVATLKK